MSASEMTEVLRRLVEAESFSTDREGVELCGNIIDELCRDMLGSGTETIGSNRIWRRQGERPVLLLCHYDTVWPRGTLAEFPFTVDDGVARGPGVFDMKGGIVQCLWAVREVTDGPITILFTGDEEIGSPASRSLIEEEALNSRAVLVLEPAEGTSLKLARKGTGTFRVDIRGRASHAGLAPEQGINSALELADQIRVIDGMGRPDEGTTVTVTMLGGGSANNVVPESAWCAVDLRMWSAEEAERIDRGLHALEPIREGATISISGGVNRMPMERKTTEELYRRVVELGYDFGAAEVGGASDGNFTAALGVPTLDGLGSVGGGAHARDEHVLVEEMPRRAEMVARLLESLLADG
ncbi:MAG: M20 family metallopeptidase [Actinomycetota bacterium]